MARIERQTLNGQTIRAEVEDGEVKISILKDKHYRGIAKLASSDGLDIAKTIIEALEADA